jgi:hypothetical protein
MINNQLWQQVENHYKNYCGRGYGLKELDKQCAPAQSDFELIQIRIIHANLADKSSQEGARKVG